MKLKEKSIAFLAFIKPHLLRLFYLGFILSFLLPYVDVRGCSNKKMQYLHGYDLLNSDQGIMYYVTIGIFAAFFILSFIKRDYSRSFRAFGSSWKALCAGFSGLVILFMPRLQFLFDEVFYRSGFGLGLACAAAVFADGGTISLKELAALWNERPAGPAEGFSPALRYYHYGVIVLSILMIPVYFFLMRKDIIFAMLIFLLQSAPLAVSQFIVLEGVRRGEKWTRIWAVAVSFIVVAALALIVMGFM